MKVYYDYNILPSKIAKRLDFYNICGCNVTKNLIYFFYISIEVVRAASPLLLRMIILGAFFIYSTVSKFNKIKDITFVSIVGI